MRSEAGSCWPQVARYETERLYNASELRRLTGDASNAARIEKSITETADALGLPLIRGKRYQHTHVVEERPSGNNVFRTLLQDVERRGLGHTMFSYLSAVDHGTTSRCWRAQSLQKCSGSIIPAERS